MAKPFVLIAALFALAACASAPPPASPFAHADELTELLEARREALHIPGMSFVAVVDGRVVYAQAFGERDIESHAPATLDTLFPIGSATKSFTAAAIVLSQDAGVLSLDDQPQRYLPYFHMADEGANANVTLRDMLSHRTGLMSKNDLAAMPETLSREDYIRVAGGAEPTAPMRARFQYSNVMFTAAGEAAGAANHMSWEQLIETRILAPLGMQDSVANVRDMPARPDRATGYIYNGAAWTATPPTTSLRRMAPAGSIASSANDMSRWLLMLAKGGVHGEQRFMSEAGFREMITPEMPINDRMAYALGWATFEWNGLQIVEHNGGGEGIAAIVSFIPERRTGFVLLSNTSPHDFTVVGNAANVIYPLLLGMEAPIALSISTPDLSEAPVERPSGVTPEQVIARMARAVGGEAALRRHSSLHIEATKSYDNQGVRGTLTMFARAPASRDDEEVWIAPDGREYARVRVYFDGERGGQATTFGQTYANDDATNSAARRVNAFRPLLELNRLYEGFDLSVGPEVGGEATYALALQNDGETQETWIVSQRSYRLVRRVTPSEVVSYSDYRAIDGEQVPFTTTIQDGLGVTTIRVQSARFNETIPENTFAPR